ncbi:MAG: cation transporter [SAR202 cluster bacterium]|jgi:divalent metal cation (Fe/Co/Zn/Cd) transporter|nr:cation transporter [SAR202 cluster bacterium]MDP6513933.1 cation transporter [SAR202 cluster bacterium]MDP6713546.1 cation transporter [SAR202 cluster bacterium]
MIDQTSKLESLRRRALLLVWIGTGWNVVEMVVALWVGVSTGSVALMAYGLDSVIELIAGGALIWRLGKSWSDDRDESQAERRAEQLVGITFFLLSAYILVQSVVSLMGWVREPEPSAVGVVLALASVGVMTVLFFYKRSIAERIGSRALRAEAMESLVCDIQDLTILVGLGANALLGWWWADPVAALALIPLLVREGMEAVFESDEDDD